MYYLSWIVGEHIPSYNNIWDKHDIHWVKDCMKKFCECLKND